MSPCRGCMKRANDPQGNFKMRFICSPNGKLLKNAPGNFKCGEVYYQPYHMSKFAFWELLEETPVLKVPEMGESDSVFDEAVFVPDDEEGIEDDSAGIFLSQSTMVYDGDANISPNTPAIIEPYMTYSQSSGKLKEYVPPEEIIVEQGEISPKSDLIIDEEIIVPESTRDDLKKILDEAGIEYNKRARTETLRKLVDAFGSKK